MDMNNILFYFGKSSNWTCWFSNLSGKVMFLPYSSSSKSHIHSAYAISINLEAAVAADRSIFLLLAQGYVVPILNST